MKLMVKNLVLILTTMGILVSCQTAAQKRNNYIPETMSPEARAALTSIYELEAYARVFPAVDDLDGWREIHKANEEKNVSKNQSAVESKQVTVTETVLGGVPVLDIRPDDWVDNGKILIYTHGGAYTLFSASSTLWSSAAMSRATGLRVVSVDYTTAPFADWQEIQDQVVLVFQELLNQGFSMNDLALYGDSAGGGLAISTVLNLRNRGMGMPAAVALLSPWADISTAGDTYHTLLSTDPTLSNGTLNTSALAYADGLPLTDPRVSPIYGDFSDGFSPTIITEGTKCIFLSNSVRMYQALEAAGVEVKLDVYEGMWHVFQGADIPETDISYRKLAEFFNSHLNN